MTDYHPNSLIAESLRHPTPAFWFSAKRLRENYHHFVRGLPGVKVFFPPKANSTPAILELLHREGAGFDAASFGEMKILKKLKVSPAQIIFTTPVKPVAEIRAAYHLGVRVFVADSFVEVDKIAKHAPGSKVLVRLQTSNKGSQWPLSRRFGIEVRQAASLLQHVSDWKLVPYGLCFHVGSQCSSPKNWRDAIRRCAKVVRDFEQRSGYELKVLDLGGGFPVCYTKPVPSLEEVFGVIRRELERAFRGRRGLELWVEPGRAIVADASFAVTRVIGRTRRGRDHWLFCDLGVFNGLLELIEPSSRGFGYEIYAPGPRNGKADGKNGNGRQRTFTLTGPSCDGDDIIAEHVALPDIGVGDRIYFLKAGAYSTVYGSAFCGNVQPKIYLA